MGGLIAVVLALTVGVGGILIVRRGVGAFGDWLFATSPSFSFECPTDHAPADAIARSVVPLIPAFGDVGFTVEEHSVDTLVIERRTPIRAIAVIPLVIALLISAGALASSSSHASQHAGLALVIGLGVAIVLSLAVKATERVLFSVRPAESGSVLTVVGKAPAEVQEWLWPRVGERTGPRPPSP